MPITRKTEKRMKTNNWRNFSFNFPRQWLGFFLQKQSMISQKISFTRMDNVVPKSDLSSTRNLSQMRHFNYTQWDLMRLFIIEFLYATNVRQIERNCQGLPKVHIYCNRTQNSAFRFTMGNCLRELNSDIKWMKVSSINSKKHLAF